MNTYTGALTWNELAAEYNAVHAGRRAQTLGMDTVFEWAARQSKLFRVAADGSIHKVAVGNEEPQP